MTLQPPSTMPTSGEFIIAVWEGDWDNPKQKLKFYHAYAFPRGPVWGARYSTEEGEAYKINGWMPLPEAREEGR